MTVGSRAFPLSPAPVNGSRSFPPPKHSSQSNRVTNVRRRSSLRYLQWPKTQSSPFRQINTYRFAAAAVVLRTSCVITQTDGARARYSDRNRGGGGPSHRPYYRTPGVLRRLFVRDTIAGRPDWKRTPIYTGRFGEIRGPFGFVVGRRSRGRSVRRTEKTGGKKR